MHEEGIKKRDEPPKDREFEEFREFGQILGFDVDFSLGAPDRNSPAFPALHHDAFYDCLSADIFPMYAILLFPRLSQALHFSYLANGRPCRADEKGLTPDDRSANLTT